MVIGGRKSMTTLPKSDSALWQVFKNGRLPEIGEFQGEYTVRMLTIAPSLHGMKHRKVFFQSKGDVCGKNILFRHLEWGSFFLKETRMQGPERLQVVVINYGRPENTILTRRIRDLVRAVDGDKLYLGRFNILVRGKLRFLGYFSLTKIEQS